MDYPGFVPFVCNNVAYIFRDGFLYNVNNDDIRLKTGDWVNGNFDQDNSTCSDIEKTAGPLKTVISDDAFYFIGGYTVGREKVIPFGKVDISKVPVYYKPNEVVTAMYKLIMKDSCTVSVDEILFSHSKGTFLSSSAIPVDGQQEDNQEGETELKETRDDSQTWDDTNGHRQDATNDPFYSLSDPKYLGDNDSDSDIPVDFDPIAAFRKPEPAKAEEEIPPVPVPKDYPTSSKASGEPELPFYYGKNAVDPSEIKSQLAPVRKNISFTPSPSSTSPLSPANPKLEEAKSENLNKNIFLMQKESRIPNSEGSSPGFTTDSDVFNTGSGYPRPFSPRYSDVEDEFSPDEDSEYDFNPDEDEEAPFRANVFDFDQDEDNHYNIDAHAYDTENSDISYPSLNNSSDIQICKIHGPAEHKPNKNENEDPNDDKSNNCISAELSSEATISSDESLHFDGRGPKEFMNDINAWNHVYEGEKFTKMKEYSNKHILFAKFENFAMLYDTDSALSKDNFGVIFRDDDNNSKYYDSLVVGGVYKGTTGVIFDNTSKNGMPDLTYYMIRPEKVTDCDVYNSAIYVRITIKKRRCIKRYWAWHDFTILEVEKFGAVGFPTKYVHLLTPDILIKGTARFYVHPKCGYFWGFVGEFTFYPDERGQTIFINEDQSYYHYLKTKFASYLEFAGPEYYTPWVEEDEKHSNSGVKSKPAQIKKDPNTPYTRRQLEDLMPTYEYLHHPKTMPSFAKWKNSFEFV